MLLQLSIAKEEKREEKRMRSQKVSNRSANGFIAGNALEYGNCSSFMPLHEMEHGYDLCSP